MLGLQRDNSIGISLIALLVLAQCSSGLNLGLADLTHYTDYLPSRRDGTGNFVDDFRTAGVSPSHLRNRKMDIGGLRLQVEDVLANPIWPAKWPYTFEDFRPCDYTRDEPTNTIAQYQYSQQLVDATNVALLPGIFRWNKLSFVAVFSPSRPHLPPISHLSLNPGCPSNVTSFYQKTRSLKSTT